MTDTVEDLAAYMKEHGETLTRIAERLSQTEDRLALRPDEVAERTGISRTRVYELIKASRLRSIKLDGVILIRPEWVIEMLEGGAA